jgi:hypothetical protein
MEDSTRSSDLIAAEPVVEKPPHMCKCGRAPWRKHQRNCVFCNREANRKYRESLKIDGLPIPMGIRVKP